MHRPVLVVLLALALYPSPAAASAARPVRPRASASATSVLPWIADDWPRAVALARARKLPIFVENWAPW